MTFSDFVERFAKGLHTLILPLLGGGVQSFGQEEIARLLFLGYLEGNPYIAEVYIKHDGATILRPEIQYPSLPKGLQVFTGSERVYNEFKEKCKLESSSLHEASVLVKDYLESCMKYQDVDSSCANIGGHIHIGALKPKGFSWIYQPSRN